MQGLKKKLIASGVGLGLLAGGLVLGTAAVSGAQETTTTQAPAEGERPDGERGGAERPGAEEMQQRQREKLTETLAPLVEAGTIDQAQSDAVVDALVAAGGERGPGGFGHKGGKGGKGGHGRGGFGLDAAAEALGMSADELREALGDGSTLGQVADDKGVDRQKLIDALAAETKERIAAKVEDGTLTQEEADEKLAGLDERIAEQLDSTRQGRGPGGRGPGGRGPGGRGDGGPESGPGGEGRPEGGADPEAGSGDEGD